MSIWLGSVSLPVERFDRARGERETISPLGCDRPVRGRTGGIEANLRNETQTVVRSR